MWQRVRVFVLALPGYFESAVHREIALRDLDAACRRPGVLMARGLLRPTICAVCRAAHLTVSVEPRRAKSAEGLFRACSRHSDTRRRDRQPKIPLDGHAGGVKRGFAA